MGRNLVLCLDGTNNKYDARNTNVVKIHTMLDRSRPDQVAYYQPGIGTFAPPGVWGRAHRWTVTRLDLAVAWLLGEHVTDAYRFLMRYYEQGDNIYIFGFSRGAYTARVLAAMLFKVGLLGQGNEELVSFAWNIYRRERDARLYTNFRYTFGRKVRVRFLGLWDTVSSVGWLWAPKSFDFTANNPGVDIVRHAVAIDERRAYFVQNLWTPHPPQGQDVAQVWFAGVHCDVGGGYRECESGLSKITLGWMTREAEQAGLRFEPKAVAAVLPPTDTPDYAAASVTAPAHESLQGLWWVVECLPKLIADPATDFRTKRLIWPLGRSRYLADGSCLHGSVFERKEEVPTYRPPNIPQRYVRVI